MGCVSSDTVVHDLMYCEQVEPARPGHSAVYRNAKAVNGLRSSPHPDHDTLHKAFMASFARNPSNPCLGVRRPGEQLGPYEWKTYQEVKDLATWFGSGLTDLCPKQSVNGDTFQFMGINSKNREEWLILDIACVFFNITIVPFYDTLGADTVTYILDQTEMETTMATEDLVPKLLELKRKNEAGKLKNIIQVQPLTEERRQEIVNAGINAYSYDDIIQLGKSDTRAYVEPGPNDVYTFSYTSGTTGDPKGAMLTQRNLMATLSAVYDIIDFTPDDVHLSYLPMPHVFEKLCFCSMIANGCRIGLYGGEVLKLKEDLAELKPTFFPSVPRLFSRMYDVINGMFREATGVKKSLIQKALASKLEHLRKTGSPTHGLWDALVFKKTKAVLGGRVRMCVTGSAPISAEVLDFLKVCFCSPILEGYGQTECTGVVTVTSPLDPEAGHVGGPGLHLEMKLEDIPDMEYLTTDMAEGFPAPRGEVCYRGPAIIKGYFKLPDKTAEAIDSDGWLHSGDVGLIRPNGSLKIIDRKKNIFKLAQGEYVAPEKMENMFTKIPIVAQIFVHGDSLEAYVVAVVVPDEANLKKWAEAEGKNFDFRDLCGSEDLKKHIQSEIGKAAKEEGLLGFEIPRNIYVHNEPFTPESDILTPTFKLKRNIAAKVFRNQIDQMYGK